MTKQGGFFVFALIWLSSGYFYFLPVKSAEQININTAGVEELLTLPGIGPVKAQAIVDYREQSGPFSAIEEIMNVPGIGQVTYDGMKDYITVGGGGQTAPQPPPYQEEAEEEEEDEEEEIIWAIGDVVINEFVSDPAAGEVEWIELYNKTNYLIELRGWTITEGSGAKTALNGELTGIGAGKFAVVEKPKGNLNNAGDIMILRDQAGREIDRVVYGNWNDGNINGNAPVAPKSFSTARLSDGYDTGSNVRDFVVTATPTKGRANIITLIDDDEDEEDEEAGFDYSNDIVVSEIFPDPVGRDDDDEFVELYNRGARDVNLTGWRLGDDSARRFTIAVNPDPLQAGPPVIKAGGFMVFYRKDTKIALNNNGDSAKLYRPLEDNPVWTVRYDKAIEGWSYNLECGSKIADCGMAGKYVWSEIVTPGEINIIKEANRVPVVDFDCPAEALIATPVRFDSSDTFDEDTDALTFFWDFGDNATNTLPNPEHTFFKAGTYSVKLTVSDGKSAASKTKKIKVVNALKEHDDAAASVRLTEAGERANGEYGYIIINEFLPDPVGPDEASEWIELYNPGDFSVNMLDWQLDDEEGGSRPFRWREEFWFGPDEYLVIWRSESKLALNNTGDSVRLFDPAGALVDEVIYGKAAEGEVYARGANGKWFWSTMATPGEPNVITVSNSAAGKAIAAGASTGGAGAGKQIVYHEIEIERVREMEAGDSVKVSGTVAVLPGVLGAQFFYIVGSPGVQVYNYKKEFPPLEVGDLVAVSGELAQTQGEWRIKTKSAADIERIDHLGGPEPEELAAEGINDESVGRLVKVSGEITSRKSATVFLDDGISEAVVYIKQATGISPASLKAGREASITGIVGRTAAGARLMPRSPHDIVFTDQAAADKNEPGRVLGEVAASDEWTIPARDRKSEMFKYLLVMAGAVIAVLGGLLIKARRG